jgi:DNA-binding NtrC family response regulator
MERQYIQSVLALTEGSITKAAQLLKIDRTYLHQKLAQLNSKSDE